MSDHLWVATYSNYQYSIIVIAAVAAQWTSVIAREYEYNARIKW